MTDDNSREDVGRLRRIFGWLRARRGAIGLATLSGVLVFLSFPAWNLFPLAFIALIPVLLVTEKAARGRDALAWGWWMGLITNLGGFYWVAGMLEVYGFLPRPISIGLYAALCAQQGITWALAFGAGRWATLRGAPIWLAYPAALAVAEIANPLIFPWYFGNSQYLDAPFIQVAELGGVTLLSASLVLANVAILELATAASSRRRPLRWALVSAAVICAQFVYGFVRISQVEARIEAADSVRVGAVQANIGIYEKSDPESLLASLLLHQQISAELAAEGAELILWPETAYAPPAYFSTNDGPPRLDRRLMRDATALPPSSLPLPPRGEPEVELASLEELVPPQRGFDVPLITGTLMWRYRTEEEAAAAPTRRGNPYPIEIFNSAMLLGPDGAVLGTYDKTLRMIFSEYVPGGYAFYRLTGLSLYDMIPGAGDFQRGSPSMGFDVPVDGGTVRVGVMICYEDIMPAFGRAIHPGGPELIVNLTNDAWFLDTAEPELHLALSVFRSIEQRTTLIRATNTGISAVIDPVGRVVAATPTFEEATLLEDVPRMAGARTPFMRIGNWPSWGSALILLGIGIRHRRRAS